METTELLANLSVVFSDIVAETNVLEDEAFFYKARPGNWSVAEEIQHLSLSILPLNNVLSQPAAVVARWGSSNRKSRSMEKFRSDYGQATAGQEWKAFPPFVPKTESESPAYAALHHTEDQNRVDDFYKYTGTGIEMVRDKFQIVRSAKKEGVLGMFAAQSGSLLTTAKQMEDAQLHNIQLPLPYIGLVTLKEALLFTLFHTGHHFNSIKNRLSHQLPA